MENTGHIRYKQYIWEVHCKYQGGVAREAYKEAGLQGPRAVVALPAACLVNTGPYRALRYILHTFDRVLRITTSNSDCLF
jgi:hypothetical protein